MNLIEIANHYKLFEYYSGGGCYHLAKTTAIKDLMWLINDVVFDDESSMEPPTSEHQRCIFGLDLLYMEDENLMDKVMAILEKHDVKAEHDPHCFYFYDVLSQGMDRVNKINDEISLLVKEVA